MKTKASRGVKNSRLIVVLGAHRSGTSAITRGLQVMGVQLGDHLMPPAEGENPRGFWEDLDFNALNVEMLKSLGSDWDRLAPIQAGDVKTLRENGYFVRAVELLRRKVGPAACFGFKDPRVALLLPFWKEVFSHCHLDVRYVIVLRHPFSVASSLAKRNGFDPEKSHLLWLGHIIVSLSGTIREKRVLVDYDRVMQSPHRELFRIAKLLDLRLDQREFERYEVEFLDQRLRHTTYDLQDLSEDHACHPLVREIYVALHDIASGTMDKRADLAAQRKTARWMTEFERLKSVLKLADRLSARNGATVRGLVERDGRIATLHQAVAERDSEIANLHQAVAEHGSRIASLHQGMAERDSRIASLHQGMAERDSRIASLHQGMAERDSRITSLHETVVDLSRRLVGRGEGILRLDSELRESRSQLAAILSSNSWKITRPLREARRWVTTPRTQFQRYLKLIRDRIKPYTKAALKQLKRVYQVLPLSPETKTLHRNWLQRHAPRVLSATSAHRASVIPASTSSQEQAQPHPATDGPYISPSFVERIILPTSNLPIVSIIVPVYGNVDYTLRCLKAIENYPPGVAFEVIVVDDCSSNNSADLLSKVSGVRLITSTENGFIGSCNEGAKAATGQYLLFLKNTTEVMSNWADNVLRAVNETPVRAGMKIAAVTMVYNEAPILPYFLRHYRYLDEIHVLYETDSTDETLEILMRAPNVVIEKGHIEGGLDDIKKIDLINNSVRRIKADWVYVVDPDEFIFPPNNEAPYEFLKRQSCDVVRSGMYQVYRHRHDKDLDPSSPPVPQRVHGDADLHSTEDEEHRASNSWYVKPNIVRPSRDISFTPGHHFIEGDPPASPELWVGAHWQMADPSIAIARRMERKGRVSERNKKLKMGWQHFDITSEKIKEEIELHMNDPIIDALLSFRETTRQEPLPENQSDNQTHDLVRNLNEHVAPESVTPTVGLAKGSRMPEFNLLDYPICLSLPRRTVPFLSWRQHVPFAMLLIAVVKPRTLVELGVHYGDSYCAFCQAVAELRLGTSCYGVDTWKGDPHASFYGPEVLADLTAHHDPLYGTFSHLVQSTFDEAVKHFPDGGIDILHIDGYHTYNAVKHDFETWLPKLASRGIVLFHDIVEKQGDFGVWRLWDELKSRYPFFEFVHCHGLGIVAAGEEPPKALSWLFEANDKEVAAIQNFFFCLGDRLTDKVALSAKEDSADALTPKLEIASLRVARNELAVIQSSKTWRLAKKLNSLIDATLPLGTRRRAYVRRVLTRLDRPLN